MLKWLIDAYFLKNSNVFYTAYSETSDNQFYIQVPSTNNISYE